MDNPTPHRPAQPPTEAIALPETLASVAPSAIGATAAPEVPGYEMLGELGRGGMGVVYKARHTVLGRVVALKVMRHAEYAGTEELARFLLEAESVARLQHPNVVQLFEAGQHRGLPFLTLEFVAGGSLAEQLDAGPLPPREAAETVRAIARGVQHAHEQGVIHRDLKPANVLRGSDGTFKVTDFGLARKVDAAGLTATGAVLGTPSYMAPEQAAGKKVGPAADVYALGAILYECLTGQPPFQGDSPLDTLLRVVADDPIAPRELVAGVPKDLEAICLKCLHKDAARRYSSAAAVCDDLTRYLEGEPVSVSQSGLLDRLLGALDRVQLLERFASYGSLLLWFAPLMFLPEVWVTLVVAHDWPGALLALAQFGRVGGFVLLVGWHRGWRWAPQGAAERQIWAIWGGYLLACFTLGLSGRLALGFEAAVELKFYQGVAVLAALAFFCLAANFWGYCAVIGLLFLALSFVMAIDLFWAPLEFGALWGTILVFLGLRLRRLGKAAAVTSR